MTPADCIRAAIPDADDALCHYIVWNRTPFPMGRVSARDFYRAASAFKRAGAKGIRLCETCHNIAVDDWNCASCNKILSDCRKVAAPSSLSGDKRNV